jgi:hypothetical protein
MKALELAFRPSSRAAARGASQVAPDSLMFGCSSCSKEHVRFIGPGGRCRIIVRKNLFGDIVRKNVFGILFAAKMPPKTIKPAHADGDTHDDGTKYPTPSEAYENMFGVSFARACWTSVRTEKPAFPFVETVL